MTRLSSSKWEARAAAYEEAAQHLLLKWTDDPKEAAQGEHVSRILLREAERCRVRADVVSGEEIDRDIRDKASGG